MECVSNASVAHQSLVRPWVPNNLKPMKNNKTGGPNLHSLKHKKDKQKIKKKRRRKLLPVRCPLHGRNGLGFDPLESCSAFFICYVFFIE